MKKKNEKLGQAVLFPKKTVFPDEDYEVIDTEEPTPRTPLRDSLDELLDSADLHEKSEMEGVAEQIFTAGRSRTKLNHGEISMAFVTDIVFDALGMSDKNPTQRFMELKKSHEGWSTEKFVQTTQNTNDVRSGALQGMKDRLFSQK